MNRLSERPKSAPINPRRKDFRFNSNEELNAVRANISQTFSRESRGWNEIKGLTADRVGKHNEKKIDNLCIKFSIIPNPKHNKWGNQSIDVDFLLRNYTRNKSKQQNQKQRKATLKNTINATLHPKKTRPFFALNAANLRRIQANSKKDLDCPPDKHPYLYCYETTQAETIANYTTRDTLDLRLLRDCPALHDEEDWEKDHLRVSSIYSHFRSKSSLLNKKPIDADISQFFVTDL